jgi:hypothetical protein
MGGRVRAAIIWLNGTFGAGKTTTATLLTQRSRRLRLFDPESVGYMLRPNLVDHPVSDFRHWSPWRVLTPIVADELVRFSGENLVAPQTVLEEDYWDELVLGLSERGHAVLHVLLEADEPTMRDRIEADRQLVVARQVRLDRLAKFAEARSWIARRADLIVDTTRLAPGQVADRVWDTARDLIDLADVSWWLKTAR